MYNEKVMEILKSQEFLGEIRQANAIGDAGTAVSDILKFYMVIEDGKIVEAKCKVFGSVISIAVGSVCAKNLIGKTIEKALLLDVASITSELDIPANKKEVLDYAKEAIKNAIDYYYKKLEKAEKEEVK